MIVSDTFWDKIKHLFTEDEILLLTAAAVGHSICPRGVLVDTNKLETKLRSKLQLKVKVDYRYVARPSKSPKTLYRTS